MALIDNLVSYWKLDESSGNAADSVGSNTLTNNSTVTYSTGKINNGAVFNGSSNYFSVADNASLSITGNLTISCWAYLTASSSNFPAVWKWNTNGGANRSFGFYLKQSTGTIDWSASNNGTASTNKVFTTTFTANTWYHIALVYTASSTKIEAFVNGVSLGSDTAQVSSIFDSNAQFQIGAIDEGGGRLWGGASGTMVDELGIWSRALSAGEVSQLWNGGVGSQYTFSTVTIAFDSTAYAQVAAATSLTYAHTCTGSNRILWIQACNTNSATFTITGITYAGVAMTKAGTEQKAGASNTWSSLWYLVAPTIGTNNIVVTSSGSTDLLALSSSYTGARQSGVPDAYTSSSGSGDPYTQSITTVTDNSWILAGFATQRSQAAGASTTFRYNVSGYVIADSNGPKSPTGSYSLVTDQDPSGALMAATIVSFAPATSTNGNFLAFL